MVSISPPGVRRCLLITSALLSPSLALFSRVAPPSTSAYAQTAIHMPAIVVERPMPRPRLNHEPRAPVAAPSVRPS